MRRRKQGKDEDREKKRYCGSHKFTRLDSRKSMERRRKLSGRQKFGYSKFGDVSRGSRRKAYIRSDSGYKQLIDDHAAEDAIVFHAAMKENDRRIAKRNNLSK